LAASSDAGPLIWLGKCDALYLLNKLHSEIAIPEAVYEEAVTRGFEEGHEDAKITESMIAEGWIRVYKPKKRFIDAVEDRENEFGIELGKGEREAIALALEKGISIFLTNDEDAYQIGRSLDLEPKGVLYVLLKAVKERHLSGEQAKECLGRMLEGGFWLSPKIIYIFYETLDRL
jgi:predicted nucleic acid-binding protein